MRERTYTLEEAQKKLKEIKRKKRRDYISSVYALISSNNTVHGLSLFTIGVIACITNKEDATGGFVLICLSLAVLSANKMM